MLPSASRRHVPRTLCLAAGLAAVAAACSRGASPAEAPAASAAASPPAAAANQSPVEHGRHLVTVLACNDCHTPKKMGPHGPEPDTTRLLAGHPESLKVPPPPTLSPKSPWGVVATNTLTAWSGPWGISFASNLTPDRNTGIGTWSEETFVKAIRTGRHMGVSRPILPPMPWNWYADLSDQELGAIFAYLQSIPPVTNHVPEPVIAGAAPPPQ